MTPKSKKRSWQQHTDGNHHPGRLTPPTTVPNLPLFHLGRLFYSHYSHDETGLGGGLSSFREITCVASAELGIQAAPLWSLHRRSWHCPGTEMYLYREKEPHLVNSDWTASSLNCLQIWLHSQQAFKKRDHDPPMWLLYFH